MGRSRKPLWAPVHRGFESLPPRCKDSANVHFKMGECSHGRLSMKSFFHKVRKIGINPYVSPPPAVLDALFEQAGRTRGPIPVRGTLNGAAFRQTLVKFRGVWRLYLNTQMRRDSGIDVGAMARVRIEFDPEPREVSMPPALKLAMAGNKQAAKVFGRLNPSRRKEILAYLNSLKSEAALSRNITRLLRDLSEAA